MILYDEALGFLYSLHDLGIKLGLDKIQEFCNEIKFGHPNTKIIHIAGTNGKGSTAAFLHQILDDYGYSVGLYTSPHLLDFRERIQINGKKINKKFVSEFVQLYQQSIKKYHLTFFEAVTIMAMLYFHEEKCEFVIMETGMGGRLDATNIFQPLLSIITNVDMDHCDYLGHDIESIAKEKAGIIKAKVPLFTAESKKNILEIFYDVCKEKESECYSIHDSIDEMDILLAQQTMKLLGDHQQSNAKLAYHALLYLKPDLKAGEVIKSIRRTYWPGRLDIWKKDKDFFLDVSHNSAGLKTSLDFLKRNYVKDKWTVITSIASDKQIDEMIQMLGEFSQQLYLYPLKNERFNLQILKKACEKISLSYQIWDINQSVAANLRSVDEGKKLLIGSHYLLENFLNTYR